jgi:hypothetical protein
MLSGFGVSLRTHDRPYLLQAAYHQASALTLAATVNYLRNATSGCTELAKVVTVAGSSEGGYAAITSAYALRQLGLRIRQVHAAGPLLNLDVNFKFLVQGIDEETITGSLPQVLPLTLFSLSNDFPGRANADTNQTAISSNWSVPGNLSRNIFQWIRGPNPLTREEIEALLPPPNRLNELGNPELVALYREGIQSNVTEPCAEESGLRTEGVTDLLCQAISDVSLWDAVRSAPFPLELCYSEIDNLVTVRNFPDDVVNSGNENVTRTTEVFTGLPITGDHGATLVLCNIGIIRSFTDPTMQSDDPPNEILDLDSDQEAACRSGSTETTPEGTTSSPTPSPAMNGTTPEGDPISPTRSPVMDGTDDKTSGSQSSNSCLSVYVFATLAAFAAQVF